MCRVAALACGLIADTIIIINILLLAHQLRKDRSVACSSCVGVVATEKASCGGECTRWVL